MQTIYLDISNKGVTPTIYAKQGDVGRKFLAIITDSGTPYYPSAGSVLSAWYSGESGDGNYTNIGDDSAFEINGNKISVELITQMLSNSGEGIICITLNEANGDQISSWNIKYITESVPGYQSEEAKQYYTAFSKSVEELPYPDESLSIKGKSADAKAVGDALLEKQPKGNYLEDTDTTLLVEGKAADAAAVGEKLGKKAEGTVFVEVSGLEELTQHVIDALSTMADYSTRTYSVWDSFEFTGFAFNMGGLLTIHRGRTDDNFVSFCATYEYNEGNYRLRLSGEFDDHVMEDYISDWEWENPPLLDGVEYRTTEKWNGKSVYVMQVSLGAMPNKTSKEYSLPISSQIIPVSYEGYAYNDEAEWTFPVYAAGAIAAYMGYKNDAIYVNATTNLSNYNLRVVVKYTK